MDLLKYLEPMKDLPKRFSNLAFWRDVRKFKDEVVNALEYVDSWGRHIESSLPSTDYVKSSSVIVKSYRTAPSFYVQVLDANSEDGTSTVLPIVSTKFELSLEGTDTAVLVGKHIDSIVARYVDGNNISRFFVFPSGCFSRVYLNGAYRNGYVIDSFSCFYRVEVITTTDLPAVKNSTLKEITVYYH